jgi:hypothetical protein
VVDGRKLKREGVIANITGKAPHQSSKCLQQPENDDDIKESDQVDINDK